MPGPFIDTHLHVRAHVSPPRLSGGTYPTPQAALEQLRSLGVTRAVVLPGVHPDGLHDVQGNGEVLDICSQYPDFFIPFMNINPRQLQNTPETDLGHLMRFYKAHGCRGIGEMSCNIALDDPQLRNLFHHAEAEELPLLFHIGYQQGGCYGLIDRLGLPLLEQALQDFPKLIFVAHSQPFWSQISGDVNEDNWMKYPKGPVTPGGAALRLIRDYPNLWADLSAGSGFNALTRDPDFGYQFMEEFQDRLLYANDLANPNQDLPLAGYLNEALAAGNMTGEAYKKIAHANAERLLKL